MSAAKGPITVRRYGVPIFDIAEVLRVSAAGVRAHHFMPIEPDDALFESSGWVSSANNDQWDLDTKTLFHKGQVRLTMRTDVVKPNPADIKREMALRIKDLGRRPSKDDKKEIKEMVMLALKKKVLPKSRCIDMVWLTDLRRGYFFSQAKGACETFEALFARSFKIPLTMEDAGKWAVELLGTVDKGILEPTPELWKGFSGVRPVAKVVEDEEAE